MIERIISISMQIALQIIFSQFDEIMGPYAMVFYPNDVPEDIQSRVSSKTIDLFTDSDKISDELAIMSFLQLKKKGLVKILEWKDITQRGGRREATLTILFEEKDDSILYKYNDDIEEQINEFLIDFQPLVQEKEEKNILQDKLKKFHENIQEFLLKLASKDLQFVDSSKEFPKTQEHSMKTEFAFKTIIIGDPGVGKTSMVRRSTGQEFRKSYLPTIGTNINNKNIILYDTDDFVGSCRASKIRKTSNIILSRLTMCDYSV